MATQLAPMRIDLPPPTRYLLRDERPVAWLAGDRVGFFGFAHANEAANAAWVAYRTISRKLARVLGVRPTPIDTEPLAIEWRGGHELIVASGRPIAELVRPHSDAWHATRWFGFTIDLPPGLADSRKRDVVLGANHALFKSGIAWAMVRPRPRYRPIVAEYATPSASVFRPGRLSGIRERLGRRSPGLEPPWICRTA
jgi:hypothetical protein